MKSYKTIFALLLIAAIGFSSCKKNTKDLEAQIAKLEQMLSTAQTDITALRTEHNAQTDVKSLEAELQKLSDELAKLRQDYENTGTPTSTPTDLTELENAISNILNRLTELEDATPSPPTDLAALEKQLSDLAAKLNNTQASNTDTTDLSTITNALNTIRKDIKDMTASLPSSFDQIALDKLIARIDALESQAKNNPPTKGIENGHEWVDLGLSVMWATCNIDASHPEDYGNYYAWGELEGCDKDGNGTKKVFNWTTYLDSKNRDGAPFDMYNTTGMELEDKDDVAHVKWGNSWRMPTKQEFDDLYNFCIVTLVTRNGVKGRLFTSMNNGQAIFLPSAGYRQNSSLNYEGYSYYWSRSLTSSYVGNAYYLLCHSDGVTTSQRELDRFTGFPIRAVCLPASE